MLLEPVTLRWARADISQQGSPDMSWRKTRVKSQWVGA